MRLTSKLLQYWSSSEIQTLCACSIFTWMHFPRTLKVPLLKWAFCGGCGQDCLFWNVVGLHPCYSTLEVHAFFPLWSSLFILCISYILELYQACWNHDSLSWVYYSLPCTQWYFTINKMTWCPTRFIVKCTVKIAIFHLNRQSVNINNRMKQSWNFWTASTVWFSSDWKLFSIANRLMCVLLLKELRDSN